MPEKMVLTVEEMGRRLGVSRPTAYKLVNTSNGFPVLRIGRRVLVPVEQLNKWVEEQSLRAK